MSTPEREQPGVQKSAWRSDVDRDPNARNVIPPRRYANDKHVKATVDGPDDKRVTLTFQVAAGERQDAQWKYQLRKRDGKLQGDGQWFSESGLRPAKQ